MCRHTQPVPVVTAAKVF